MGKATASCRRSFLHSLATIRLPNFTRSTSAPQSLETLGLESAAGVEPSDEALIALVCQGNTEAFAGLFRRYARFVRGVALRVLKDPSEAEDLLQDIFILPAISSGKAIFSKAVRDDNRLKCWKIMPIERRA